jgi:multiple antibiotic resistance protein
MSGHLEFALLTMGSIFAIVDPIGSVPAFLAMTPTYTPAQRTKAAGLACLVAAGVLLIFAFAGRWIFKLLGITMPAFQLAASIVLLLVALDMLRAQASRVRETEEETHAGAQKEDIAITPLGVPLLAGPGAITAVILFQSQAGANLLHNVILGGSISTVILACYIIFRLSAHGAAWLNPIALRIGNRIMGVLLAAVAFQFGLDAIKAFRETLLTK